jgi:hypothetical protein
MAGRQDSLSNQRPSDHHQNNNLGQIGNLSLDPSRPNTTHGGTQPLIMDYMHTEEQPVYRQTTVTGFMNNPGSGGNDFVDESRKKKEEDLHVKLGNQSPKIYKQ